MTEPVHVEYVTPPQPRTQGRYAERLDVGLSRRLTQRLREALGHGGGAPEEDQDVDARMAAQAALIDAEAPDVDLDARLTEQAEMGELVGAKNLLTDLATTAALEATHTPVDDVDLEARLLAQAEIIDRLDDAEGMEFDAVKIRKWNPDLHPRDRHGRFATIGSLVSFGNGESGKVVGNGKGGRIQVEKADGTRVDVNSKDTTVTASAAAAAVLGNKTPGSQAPAALKGDRPDPGPTNVPKPSPEAPDALKPAPSKAERATAVQEQQAAYWEGTGMSPTDAAAKAKTDSQHHELDGTVAGGIGDRMVAAHRADPKGAVAAARAQGEADGPEGPGLLARIKAVIGGDKKGDKPGTRAPDSAYGPVGLRGDVVPEGSAEARVVERQAERARATTDTGHAPPKLTGMDDARFGALQAEQENRANGKPDPKFADMTDEQIADEVQGIYTLAHLDASPEELAKVRDQGTQRAKSDVVSAPPEKAPLPESVRGLSDEDLVALGTDLRARIAAGDKDPKVSDKFVDIQDTLDARDLTLPEKPLTGPGSPSGDYVAAQNEADKPRRTTRSATTGKTPDEQALSDAQTRITAYEQQLADAKTPKQKADAQAKIDDYKADIARREARIAADNPPSDIVNSPIGGEPTRDPGTSTGSDDAVNRSLWTGGQPPNGLDGKGMRKDGRPYGSGYDPGDPREDPSYDQYVEDLNARTKDAETRLGDTETIHDKVDGVPKKYRADREAIHNDILDHIMADYSTIPRDGKAIILAGPPGAGKSTVIQQKGHEFGITSDGSGLPQNFAVVNPDDFKALLQERGLPEYDGEGFGPEETAHFVHEESAHLADRLRDRLAAEKVNVILDGTFAGHPDKQASKVQQLKAEGYSVAGVLVDGDVDTSQQRAAQRHRKPPLDPGGPYQGRYVATGLIDTNRPDEETMSATFGRPHKSKSSINMEKFADKFDGGVLYYDNTGPNGTELVHSTVPGTQSPQDSLRSLEDQIGRVDDPKVQDALQAQVDDLRAALGTKTLVEGLADFEAKVKMSAAQRDRKPSLPDGSFPIGNVDDLDAAIHAYGRAGDKAKAKAWIIKRAKDLDAESHLPDKWDDDKTLEADLDLEVKAEGGADKNRGGAEKLRAYWVHGEGAAKIGWGTDGDFLRCVSLVSEHMDPERAKGYCQLRHHDATGAYAGHAPGEHKTLADFGLTLNNAFLERKATDPEAADAPLDSATNPDDPETVAPHGELDNANPVPDGVMVALYPPDAVAHALAYPGGEDRSELHVTLAYLGKTAEAGDVTKLRTLVETFASDSYDIDGEVSGLGRFAGETDGDPFYASVDCPELPDFRTDLIDALTAAGYAPKADHGFTPHITLGYLQPDDPMPLERLDAMPCTFGFLSLAYGPDVWDFPLNDNEAGAAPDAPTDVVDSSTPVGIEVVDEGA